MRACAYIACLCLLFHLSVDCLPEHKFPSFNITLPDGCDEEIVVCLKTFHIEAATCIRDIFSNDVYAAHCHEHVVPVARKWKEHSENWHEMAGRCLSDGSVDAPTEPLPDLTADEEALAPQFGGDTPANMSAADVERVLECLFGVDETLQRCRNALVRCKPVAACLGYGNWQMYISNLRNRHWFEYVSKLREFSNRYMSQMVQTIRRCLSSG